MKRRHIETRSSDKDKDTNSFIDDEEDSEEEFYVHNNKKPRLTDASHTKLKNYRNIIKERTITYDKILKAELPEDDTIWFIEYLDILENLDEYTEEYYRIKTLIYNKYKELQKKK